MSEQLTPTQRVDFNDPLNAMIRERGITRGLTFNEVWSLARQLKRQVEELKQIIEAYECPAPDAFVTLIKERDQLKQELERVKAELKSTKHELDTYSDYGKQRDQLKRQVEELKLKNNKDRDGNWLDNSGACKVCGGEIPYGHTENCDIYKMEKENDQLRAQNAEIKSLLMDASQRLQLHNLTSKRKDTDLIEAIRQAIDEARA